MLQCFKSNILPYQNDNVKSISSSRLYVIRMRHFCKSCIAAAFFQLWSLEEFESTYVHINIKILPYSLSLSLSLVFALGYIDLA